MNGNRKKQLLIYNPHSGKGTIKERLSDIVDVFTKSGYEVTVYPTQAAGDATRKIKECAIDYDLVCACGGDGTISEAVSGMLLLGKKIPLGIISVGSTNDVGQSLGLPSDPAECAKAVANGVLFDYDVGWFNGKNFVYVAAFGAFTSVSYETPQDLKNILGHAAYLAEGIRRINDIRGYNITIEHDDETIKGSFVYGSISNSITVGGIKNFVPDGVCFDDGLFEVCLIKTPTNPRELSSTLTDAALSKLSDKNYVTFKTSHLKITCNEPLAWTLDGEAGGEHKEVEIKNLKQAVRLKIGFNEITAEQQFVKLNAPMNEILGQSPDDFFDNYSAQSKKE